MTGLLRKFGKNESGATAIEYGLIASLIGVVLVGALTSIGTSLSDTFHSIRVGLGGD
jgi:pilus assembly protein Flp/PilA